MTSNMGADRNDTVGGAPAPAVAAVAGGFYPIRIDAEGAWYYRGSLIRRRDLISLFAGVLRRDESGDYWLVTPGEQGRIIVDEVPFLAVELAVESCAGTQLVRFRTNLDEWITAGPEHPIRVEPAPGTREPRPYILVRPGIEARIIRPVYYELVEHGVPYHHEGEEHFGLWSRQTFYSLGRLPEE